MDQNEMAAALDSGFGKLIGIEFTEVTADRVRAHYTITPQLLQPWGIVHGGVHCSVVETLASVAGQVLLGDRGNVVGVNNSTDFLRASRDGRLEAEALPIHRGRSQQLWVVTITDEDSRMIARGQVRLQNITETATIG